MLRSLGCLGSLSVQYTTRRKPSSAVVDVRSLPRQSANGVNTRLTRHKSSVHKNVPRRASVLNQATSNGMDIDEQIPRRVLLKISGEALQGSGEGGIDPTTMRSVSKEIAEGWKEGVQIAVVVGGGNFFRGKDAFEGIDRATADYVGMLATTMNAVCLQCVLESFGVQTRLQTAIEIREVAEPYIRKKAIRHLEKGRVVVFGAGTGNPFFTTDTAAALRAAEIDANEILKATKVNGVYSSDPDDDPDAELLTTVTYERALTDRLEFMDAAAMSLCRDQSIPVRVFSLFVPGNISKAVRGEEVGTVMQHTKVNECAQQLENIQSLLTPL